MKLLSRLTLFCLLLAAISSAEVLNVPDQYDTIQEAIDDANHGDSVMVAEGEYQENIEFNDVNVKIIGSPDNPIQTIIDGGENDCVVKINGGQSELAELSGFTLRNGATDGRGGGGIYSTNRSRPTLRNLIITNCFGTRGGGILCWDSNARIENVTLTENTAQAHGGGICLMGTSGAILSNIISSNNTAETGDGGGIASFSSRNVSIRGGLVSENSTRRSGGGLYSQGQQISVSDMVLRDNSAIEGRGGGIYANGHIILTRVFVIGNSAEDNGGGIFINGIRPSFEKVLAVANECEGFGGGIYLTGEAAGRCNPNLINVTIAMNSAEEDGGGIYCHDNGNPVMRNSIIWDNEPQQIAFSGEGDESSITYSYSDIQEGVDGIEVNDNGGVEVGAGNIVDDPLFQAPDEQNFQLGWENFPEEDETRSPCIDTGNPDLGEDPDGTRVDMGALYYHQVFPAIEVDPPIRIEFGEARPAHQDSVNRPIRIINPGDARLTGALRIVAEDDPFIIQRQDMGFGVQPGSDIIVVITFKPQIRGEFDSRLHITHNDPNRDEIIIALHGIGSNSPPVVVNLIEEIEILEDGDWAFVANLSDVFNDPDGDEMDYELVGNDHINFEIRDDTDLFISPEPNYYEPNVEVSIQARDEFDARVETALPLMIVPLNDPPEDFNLQTPEDNFVFSEPTATFDWETAAQNRWELDEVRYLLNFYADDEREFSLARVASNFQGLEANRILTGLQLLEDDMPVLIQWDVDAIDDSSSTRSRQRWEFVLDVLSVKHSNEAMPKQFTLYQNFPNPFNSTTTIRFGVPTVRDVNIQIYNSSGAAVDRLLSKTVHPGFHEIQWNAENQSAGLYFIYFNSFGIQQVVSISLVK